MNLVVNFKGIKDFKTENIVFRDDFAMFINGKPVWNTRLFNEIFEHKVTLKLGREYENQIDYLDTDELKSRVQVFVGLIEDVLRKYYKDNPVEIKLTFPGTPVFRPTRGNYNNSPFQITVEAKYDGEKITEAFVDISYRTYHKLPILNMELYEGYKKLFKLEPVPEGKVFKKEKLQVVDTTKATPVLFIKKLDYPKYVTLEELEKIMEENGFILTRLVPINSSECVAVFVRDNTIIRVPILNDRTLLKTGKIPEQGWGVWVFKDKEEKS